MIRAWLAREQPHVAWPACSTMGDIVKRAGLVETVRPIAQGWIAPPDLTPNSEWATDFKGHFRTGETVGITEIEDDRHLVRFATRDLGVLDPQLRFHRFAPPRLRLHCAVEPE
ncbi:MAG: hypothetical protein SH859_00480 [Hyphomicrobium aestuarii]|nr:hypothetical protein [Hyphomicrobium aestuarii]